MKITNGVLTREDIEQIKEGIDGQRFYSNLNLFNCTNGVRPGELSTFIAPKGMGKSALVKTVAYEMLSGHKPVYILLSEENSTLYKKSIADSFYKVSKSDQSAEVYLKNAYFDSMLDWEKKNKKPEFLLNHLEEQINDKKIEAIIFDNLSTSFIGSLHISAQEGVICDLRSLAAYYDIALIGVFHTIKGTNIYKALIDAEDVRGNAVAANMGAYNYVLTTFFRTNPPRAFVHIDKARYHPKANKSYWELQYDESSGLFIKDKKTDYGELEGIISAVSKTSRKRDIDLNMDVWK